MTVIELRAKPASLLGPYMRDHAVYFFFLAFYCLSAFLVSAHFGQLAKFKLSFYNKAMLLVVALCLVVFFVAHVVYWMVWRRPEHLTRAIANDLRQNYLTADRLVPGLIILATLPIFTSVFTSIKVMIPIIQPFSWDVTFALWDRVLHGGQDPWRLFQSFLHWPLVTTAINALYNAWFFILFAVVFWQAFGRANPRLRMRFFISFLMTWALIGSLAAALLSSAGPVYYERVTGEIGPYGPLMDYLKAAGAVSKVWALEVQDMLWAAYSGGEAKLGGGISAMPSMHVSMAFLFVLLAAQVNRILAWLFGIYAVFIFIGSVHLAWHYAVDGYLAIAMTAIIWWSTGWLVPKTQV